MIKKWYQWVLDYFDPISIYNLSKIDEFKSLAQKYNMETKPLGDWFKDED